MFKKSIFAVLSLIIIFGAVFTPGTFAQKAKDLAVIGMPLDDFTLPVYGDGDFKLSDAKGKNVLMVFPRGKYNTDIWCDICMYQYVELADAELLMKIMEKYNLEILFILPFDTKTTDKWFEDMPDTLKEDYAWKEKDLTNAKENEKRWADWVKKHMKTIVYEKGKIPHPFKTLLDEKFILTKRLDIYRSEWGGTKIDQNQPTIILLDTKGNVVFKYMSQHTLDRPNIDYLMKMMDILIK